MKAIQIRRFGGPEVLELADIPAPVPGRGEVLVRLKAIGINFAETLQREDRYAASLPLPAVPGSEAAGIVEAVGPDVTSVKVGQRVAVPVFANGGMLGCYAELAVISSAYAVPLPDDVSFEAAAALMVQGLTALYLIKQSSPAGKTVLVNAAAGGVGSFLVQLARRAGARRVIAAASTPAKFEFLRSLGADVCVDYSRPDWVETLRAENDGTGPDVIYEASGGSVTIDSLAALGPLGEIVIYGALNIQSFQLGVPELLRMIFNNQSVKGFALAPLLTPESLQASLSQLFAMVSTKDLSVSIGGTYPLENVGEAHRAIESRKTTGKLVLTV